MAAVSHLSFFVGFWLVGPVVFYMVKRKESRFVAFHAMQALVAHVLSAVLGLAGMLVFFVGSIGASMAATKHEPAAAFGVLALMVALGAFYTLIAVINGVAAYKAWTGEAWSIPIAGRIASGIVGADEGATR